MNPLPKPFYFDDDSWGVDTWPLLSAAYTGDLETVMNMLDLNSNLAKAQYAYYEPLHYAVKGGNIDIVEQLLKHGAHPKAPGWYALGDETPMAKAIDRGFTEIAELLENATQKMLPYTWPEAKVRTPEELEKYNFSIACGYTPNLTIVKSTLNKHPDWATLGLYEAIHHNQINIVELLITAGGDLNGFMPFACWLTPLMHTLRYKEPRWELAELLLQNNVPINGTNGLGMSALHIVVFYGAPAAVQWLLNHGANIDCIEPEFGSTPLGWAARWDKPEMMKLLVDSGADAALPHDMKWAQPKTWAQRNGGERLLKMLNM